MRIGIVGAGPAGCQLAHRLAACAGDAGTGGPDHEVLLFDPRAPYEKPCGGALGPLIERHFPDLMALPFPRHHPRRLVLRASDGSQVEQAFEQPPWAIVSRQDLGQVLLERALRSRRPAPSRWSGIGDGPTSGTAAFAVANGQVRLVRQRVRDLERTGDSWRLQTTAKQVFTADFLAGADDVRSIIRR